MLDHRNPVLVEAAGCEKASELLLLLTHYSLKHGWLGQDSVPNILARFLGADLCSSAVNFVQLPRADIYTAQCRLP
eukprot:3040329-Amphidinium_carterae.1